MNKLSIVLLSSLSVLGGCINTADTWVRPEVTLSSERTDTTLVLNTEGVLSTAHLRALDQFRNAWRAKPGERLELTTAADAELVAIEAAEWLTKRGMAPTLKRDLVLPSGAIHLAVVRYQTQIPQCGKWEQATDPNFSNTPQLDFGCSNARNLGLMVADPADLAAPAGIGESTGWEAAAAIERYRTYQDTNSSGDANHRSSFGGEQVEGGKQ